MYFTKRLTIILTALLAYPAHGAESPEEAPVNPSTVLVKADRIKEGYSADTASIAKGTVSLRDTPQSVSVVTRQRLDDQNLRTLDEALANTTGVIVEQTSSHERSYYSRGFEIQTVLLHKSAKFVIPQTPGGITAWLPPRSWACPTG